MIDENKLKEQLFALVEQIGDERLHIDAVVQLIDDAPPVDAVPVRCKDCLHNRACEIQYHAQAGDLFFCGAAERKDGDDGSTD